MTWWNLIGGAGITAVNDWTDLNTLEPATAGLERLVTNGIPGSFAGRALARRGATQWGISGADSSGIAYLAAHPIPLLSPTIPVARQMIGRNLTISNSTNSIGTLTNAFTGGATASCTFARQIHNMTGRKVSSIRLMIPIISTSGAPTISVRVAAMGGGDITSPAGAWGQGTWSGFNTVTPPDGAWSLDSPNWIMSDAITIPGGWNANTDLIMWWGCSGGTDKSITSPSEATNTFKPSLYASGKFCAGDYAAAGASGSPAWQLVDLGGLDIQISCNFDAVDLTTIVNVVAVGDSTFAEVVPLSTANGDGWATVASSLAKTNSKKWRMQSWGQGTFSMTQNLARVQSLIAAGMMQYIDVLVLQGWSWNSRSMGTLDYVSSVQDELATAKSAVLGTGRGFGLLTISPPGQRQAYEAIPTDMDNVDLTAYDTVNSSNTILAPYANIQSSVWDLADHRRFLAANSSDNVHCLIDTGIGQELQGAAAYAAYGPILTNMGYTI